MNNLYGSVNPNNMTNRDIRNMCIELQTAKNWGINEVTVDIKVNGLRQATKVAVNQLEKYQEKHRTELSLS